MGGGADAAVAGPETRKVSISFSCLLQQVVEYLKLPSPTYYLVDVGKNTVKLVMETDPGLGPSVYEGGPAKTVGESRERAAENAVRSLRMEYNIQVEDLTSKKISKFERCEFLYQMKRIELESMEREAEKVPVKWPAVPNQKRCKKYVCIDYMDVLHTLTLETMKKQIVKKHIFGKVAAMIYVVEFQKRGLPHAHFLIILKPNYKIKTPSDFDRFVSAKLPTHTAPYTYGKL